MNTWSENEALALVRLDLARKELERHRRRNRLVVAGMTTLTLVLATSVVLGIIGVGNPGGLLAAGIISGLTLFFTPLFLDNFAETRPIAKLKKDVAMAELEYQRQLNCHLSGEQDRRTIHDEG